MDFPETLSYIDYFRIRRYNVEFDDILWSPMEPIPCSPPSSQPIISLNLEPEVKPSNIPNPVKTESLVPMEIEPTLYPSFACDLHHGQIKIKVEMDSDYAAAATATTTKNQEQQSNHSSSRPKRKRRRPGYWDDYVHY
ncbi:hypothetical protein RJT34_27425 [Clitoria ternatea]|uniref:Uncharacterized protein n=1 Tax=Clitoria ternatea TaxID=43366 RepID=A0AAN9IAZ3_CLITE